jgi:hypothetical protein
MNIAALVLGIVGTVVALIPCLGMYAIPLTLLAIVFGALSMKREQGRGMAVAGLVLGIIGSFIAVIQIVLYLRSSDAIKNELRNPNSEMSKTKRELEEAVKEAVKKSRDQPRGSGTGTDVEAAPTPADDNAPATDPK